MRDTGYDIYEGIFDRAEMQAALERLADAPLVRTRAGARHILALPIVRQLADDPRLSAIAAAWLGEAPVAFRATLFDKSPAANWLIVWHQDTALPLVRRFDHPDWGPWSVKDGVHYAHAPASALRSVVALRVSLDDSMSSNGPLRVLPGSHRDGVLTEDQIERLARTTDPVDCVAPSGSVVALSPLTVHASSKAISQTPRRVLHIEYAQSVVLAPGIELAKR